MKTKYNYKFICENDEYLYDFLKSLGNGKKSIKIFNKDSSIQDILREKFILKKIQLYYQWKEVRNINEYIQDINEYMQDMIIIKY